MRAAAAIVEAQLPADLRDPSRVYTTKGVSRLLAQAAELYPDDYGRIIKAVADAGRNASYRLGVSVGLDDLDSPLDKKIFLAKMDAELDLARKDRTLNPQTQRVKRQEIMGRYSDLLEKEVMDAGNARGNNITKSVSSGARGKPPQAKAMIGAAGVYAGFDGGIIPIFARQSYAEGVRPAAYLASTYGARSAVISTKVATARGGDLGKQTSQTMSDMIVTTKDCGTDNGIDLAADDNSMAGRVLAAPYAGYPAGTFVDTRVAAALKKKGGHLLARSALTCTAPRGVCAKCAGASFGNRKLPEIGDNAGVRAANALTEPVTQGALNQKHTAGAYKGKKEFSGLNYITQFVQAPAEFADRAAVAETEGMIDSVEEAPQGGSYVRVGEHTHYVLPGFEVTVKPGDKVEAGDVLSDGLVDPKDVIRLKGLGEGRRYYAERYKKILDDSGHAAHLRNTELMARAAIDHVHIDNDDGYGDYLPGDVTSYNTLVSNYTPPETARISEVGKAEGKYLAAPLLHFSLGTKITPRVSKRLSDAGFADALIDDAPPPFSPSMTRLRTQGEDDDDWLAKQMTSYIKSNIAEDAIRGRDTNVQENIRFAPRMAIGVGYGKQLTQKGLY